MGEKCFLESHHLLQLQKSLVEHTHAGGFKDFQSWISVHLKNHFMSQRPTISLNFGAHICKQDRSVP